ncbi:MAG: A/G-specific adenine glycosylase [Planctomycetota bacterium]
MTDIARFRSELLAWYDLHQRKLPWRSETPEPYHVLVSEAMLQQTQVATVIGYFRRFIAELPTVEALASAEEQTVLRLWQGLGYYRRARNLHASAKRILAEFGGKVPDTVEALLTLPGVGRYTAGAIASLAHGIPAPILDGNVQRVLCRLDAITEDPRDTPVQQRLWKRAEQLVPDHRPGPFNSALMELGATVCTPTGPACLICPVADHCTANAHGLADTIPPPKKTKTTPLLERDIYIIRRPDDAVRIEQRPADGRWANLWQFTTVPRNRPTPIKLADVHILGEVKHALTHRRYHFRVLQATGTGAGTWVNWPKLDAYPMPKPQLRAAAMVSRRSGARG